MNTAGTKHHHGAGDGPALTEAKPGTAAAVHGGPHSDPDDGWAAQVGHGSAGNGSAAPAAVPGHEEEGIPRDLKQPSGLTVAAAALVFVALLGGLFAVGWVPHRKAVAEAEADARLDADDAGAPAVQVVRPKAAGAGAAVTLPCDVRANQDTMIYPRSSGYLKKLYVDVQDRVKAGQLLAEIDAPEVDAQLNQSRANLERLKALVVKADADAELARTTLRRYTEAQKVQPGAVMAQELDARQAAVAQAESAVASAKADVVAGEADVQRLTVLQGFQKVVAPFDGVVTSRGYDVGALLSPTTTGDGRELFRITQQDVLRVFVNVPQETATKVRVGQPAILEVRNYPGREFKGTIARSAGAINTNTRTLPLELHFPNEKGELFAGMYGTVRLTVAQGTPGVRIPTSTLVYNANGLQVAVVRDGKVHFQPITPGRDLGTEIEVTTGLSTEDQLVTNPSVRLTEGGAVRTLPEQTPAQPVRLTGVDVRGK